MQQSQRWDIFCRVIDNHGDLGVCWRLARQLRDAQQQVRLWVDDASALHWMAPAAACHQEPGIRIHHWQDATKRATQHAHTNPRSDHFSSLPAADVWIEAFGCEIPPAFLEHAAASRREQPVWINLEYLSAESWVPRMHLLPSPVMQGPAKGWSKWFFFPGFTPETGGLLRESTLFAEQAAFDRSAWRLAHAPHLSKNNLLASLFCYEPAALKPWLQQWAHGGHHLLVTPGRPLNAVRQALASWPADAQPLQWHALPYTDQDCFDRMLWGCDLNFVRGEDSLVRALWAGRALVWHIYPQEDNAHHAKLEAFLDWLQAPQSLRRFHLQWNGIESWDSGPVKVAQEIEGWTQCVDAARQRLLANRHLVDGLLNLARRK